MIAKSAIPEISLDDVAPSTDDGVFVVERERGLVFFSAGCERITGFGRSQVIGAVPQSELISGGNVGAGQLTEALIPNQLVFSGEMPFSRKRLRIARPDGEWIVVEATYSPIRDPDGEVTSVLGIMRAARQDQFADPVGGGCGSTEENGDELKDTSIGTFGRFSVSSHSGSLDNILSAIEKREILKALADTHGQRTRAAQLLGISRSRLYRRMEALGIGTPHGAVTAEA
jgi:PAS domain S-box-containing protein